MTAQRPDTPQSRDDHGILRDTKGRIRKGSAERTHGLRNKRTRWAEKISDSDFEQIVDQLVAKATDGDPVATQTILKYTAPAPRLGFVDTMDIPLIEGPDDLSSFCLDVASRAAKGEISIDQAQGLLDLVGRVGQVLAVGDLAERLELIERKLSQ